MNKESYSVKELAEILQCSDRHVRRLINNYVKVNKNGGFDVSEGMFEILQNDFKKEGVRTHSGHSPDIDVRTMSGLDVEYEIVEGFTTDEYVEFQKRLTEYPLMKEHIQTLLNQLEYMRRSGENKDRQMELLLHSIKERNFIEAKEKKLDI